MTRLNCSIFLVIGLLLSAAPASPQQSPINPKAVALLRWYPANLTTSFLAGQTPLFMVFDGANMWVTSYSDNAVIKLRASDGANLGTFNAGESPGGVAFDGANIWVTSYSDNTVTKLRASDGANMGTFNVGRLPWSVAFDGVNIWAVNTEDGTVTKLRASDGTNLGTFPVGGRGACTQPYAYSAAFDGANIWVTLGCPWFNIARAFVTKLRASDGANLGSFEVDGSLGKGIVFDGSYIWIVAACNDGGDYAPGAVTKLALNGQEVGSFGENFYCFGNGIAFDGANIWVASGTGILKLRARDLVLLGTYGLGTNLGLAFDGANIWVAYSYPGSVSKL